MLRAYHLLSKSSPRVMSLPSTTILILQMFTKKNPKMVKNLYPFLFIFVVPAMKQSYGHHFIRRKLRRRMKFILVSHKRGVVNTPEGSNTIHLCPNAGQHCQVLLPVVMPWAQNIPRILIFCDQSRNQTLHSLRSPLFPPSHPNCIFFIFLWLFLTMSALNLLPVVKKI